MATRGVSPKTRANATSNSHAAAYRTLLMKSLCTVYSKGLKFFETIIANLSAEIKHFNAPISIISWTADIVINYLSESLERSQFKVVSHSI